MSEVYLKKAEARRLWRLREVRSIGVNSVREQKLYDVLVFQGLASREEFMRGVEGYQFVQTVYRITARGDEIALRMLAEGYEG